MKIFFSGNNLVKHLWEKIKSLSVSLFSLSTLPISHQPAFGCIEHWFELSSSGASHLDQVINSCINESLKVASVTLPAEFDIIWIDLNIEEESSLGGSIKILVLEILLNLGPHVSEDATLWEESKTIITSVQLHMDNTLWLFKEGILFVPDINCWLSRDEDWVFGKLFINWNQIKVSWKKLILWWHTNFLDLEIWLWIFHCFKEISLDVLECEFCEHPDFINDAISLEGWGSHEDVDSAWLHEHLTNLCDQCLIELLLNITVLNNEWNISLIDLTHLVCNLVARLHWLGSVLISEVESSNIINLVEKELLWTTG